MTAERFQQLRNLFDAAVEREPAERASFLDAACRGDLSLRQEVARLLEAHESDKPLPGLRTDPLSRESSHVGPYEILREIGRGGMGTVYLARRADEIFQRLVAVKILRADVANHDLIRRFQREREILAGLDHPNVTRLLDGGTTPDGLPYFVMEYIEGVPIQVYCDDAQLSVEDRLRLFQQVCDAVAYAHRHGVVHRDLKPSNILVANGQVKVLDFGIARVMSGDADDTITADSLMMMTPQYASPEQVRGETATRESDVYALGVILYELLTAHSPYHLRSRVYHEIIRVVCEEPPTRPSTAISSRMCQVSLDEWKEQLRGNLDAVILKALSKLPADRYQSPAHLKDDLERHLRGEAVWARNAWWGQRTLLLASRYRTLLVCALAAIAAVICGAVKLEAKAIYFAVGAALLVALWSAATSRRVGRIVASSLFTGRLVWGVISLVAYLPFLIWGREGSPNPEWIDISLSLIPLIAFGYVLAWIFRDWWAGPRLAQFSTGKPLWIVYALIVIGEFVEALVRGRFAREHMTRFVATHSLYLIVAIVMFLGTRREIRKAGILLGGRLIRWSVIRSYAWEPAVTGSNSAGEHLWLRLDLHRRIQFLPPLRVLVEAKNRYILDPIFARYLGDWPS